MIAGWFRGSVETLIMRLVDIMMSIPAILLAVLTVAVLGPGFFKLVLVLGLTRWPRYTRVAYAQTLQVANLPFIRASELAGAGAARILFRHILPNIAGPLMVVATAEFGLMILFEAGLSFLGLGIQPPSPSWGSIMSVGRDICRARAWWIVALPRRLPVPAGLLRQCARRLAARPARPAFAHSLRAHHGISDKTVVVTGAAGIFGRWIAAYFARRGRPLCACATVRTRCAGRDGGGAGARSRAGRCCTPPN